MNKDTFKFSMITTGISSHVRYLLEETDVWLLSLSLLSSEDLFWNIHAMACFVLFFFFYLSSKRNRKFKHLVQTKPIGENIITNITKVSVAGTGLKKVRKKFRNRRARKITVSKLKKAMIVSSGHRGINFLNDYDEANEEERRWISLAIGQME